MNKKNYHEEIGKKYGVELGYMSGKDGEDPRGLLFSLSRYRFVRKS